MKVRLIATTAAALLAAGFTVAPGANAADTDVTFTVSSSGTVSLEVVTPGGDLSDPTASLTGTTSSGTIATVKVTDPTADIIGWSVSAAMTDPFKTTTDVGAAGAADDTIPCSAATVSAGLTASAITGTVVWTATLVDTPFSLDDSTTGDTDDCAPKQIGTGTVTAGTNSVTVPTSVSIAIPASALAGTYEGTIIQTAV